MTCSSNPVRFERARAGAAAVVVVVVSLMCASCASGRREPVVGSASASPGSQRPEPGPPVAVSRTIVTPHDAVSIEEIFARARVDYAERRFTEAARGFDRIVELDPEGLHAKEAWLYAAAAHDQSGDLEGAASRYLEAARRYPGERVAHDALVAAVRVLAYLERWKAVGEAADALLARISELTSIERILAYGGKALSLVFSETPDQAQYFIEKGRDVVESERLDAAGAVPRDLAQLYFALGELRRIRGERIHLAPPPPDFAAVLEQRCQLLLDAQSAYSDAMRAYDAHWSAMAGYRVGELYQSLHDELMRIPPPAAVTGSQAALFEGAMRLRYSVLLQKGLTMMEHTLSMAARSHEQSEWVRRAAAAKQTLEQSIKAEQAALDKLPYSRADLEKALENLTQKTAKSRDRRAGRAATSSH